MSYIILTRELKFKVGDQTVLLPAYEHFEGTVVAKDGYSSILLIEALGGKVSLKNDAFVVWESLNQSDYVKFDEPKTLYRLWDGLEEFVATEKSLAEGHEKPTYLGHFKDTPEKIERVPVEAWFFTKLEAAKISVDDLRDGLSDLNTELKSVQDLHNTVSTNLKLAEEIINNQGE